MVFKIECNDSFRISQPLLIGKLLTHLNPNGSNVIDLKNAYIYATGLLFNILASIILHRYSQMEVIHCGLMMQVACCSMVFKKVKLINLK